jgi:hypothetical protein
VAYLRRQLDEEREARRRADLILGQLSQANAEQARTIRAIEAPAADEPAEDAESVEEEPEGTSPRSAAGTLRRPHRALRRDPARLASAPPRMVNQEVLPTRSDFYQ